MLLFLDDIEFMFRPLMVGHKSVCLRARIVINMCLKSVHLSMLSCSSGKVWTFEDRVACGVNGRVEDDRPGWEGEAERDKCSTTPCPSWEAQRLPPFLTHTPSYDDTIMMFIHLCYKGSLFPLLNTVLLDNLLLLAFRSVLGLIVLSKMCSHFENIVLWCFHTLQNPNDGAEMKELDKKRTNKWDF